MKAAELIEAATGRYVSRLGAQRAGKAGGWPSPPPSITGQGHCLSGANLPCLGMALLPADWAGRPCPLCGGPVDVFGDHVVTCKKAGFGDRLLRTKTLFCQVLTQFLVPHDRELDMFGNGRRHADILLKPSDGRPDLAVGWTIVDPILAR